MNIASKNRLDSRWWIAFLAMLMIPRLLCLAADFPAGVTWSGALYTDEGGYLNGAIRHFLSSQWHLPGDYNPLVNLPVGQLVQALAFQIMGMSLVTARITVALASIVIIACTFVIVRRMMDESTAVLASVLLAANFFFFAYSRLALLELIALCFAMASITVALFSPGSRHRVILPVSASLLALGVLTKTTAFCALPALLLVSWQRGVNRREKAAHVLLVGALFGLILVLYYSIAAHLYPADYQYFYDQNILSRSRITFIERLQLGLSSIQSVRIVDPIAYPLMILLTLYCMVCYPPFRKNRLVWLCILWFVTYLIMMCVMAYQPPRYFLPFLVPLFILFGASLTILFRQTRGTLLMVVPILLLVTVIAYNGLRTVQYFGNLQYSYEGMAKDVRSIVEGETGNVSAAFLLGNISDTVSLATGIPAINSELGTWELERKLRTYRPGYYIALGPENRVARVLEKFYELKCIAQWDVFGNYYQGKQVYLYRLEKNRERPDTSPQ